MQHVFVVEDDPAVRESVSELLSAADCEVESFASGRQFLASVHPCADPCLLIDIRLGDTSAFGVLDALRTRKIVIPVVLMTGDRDSAREGRSVGGGAYEVLEKPFDDEVLFGALRRARARQGRAKVA